MRKKSKIEKKIPKNPLLNLTHRFYRFIYSQHVEGESRLVGNENGWASAAANPR